VIREYGNTLEKALEADPSVLAPLKLHYLRWVLFGIGKDTYFMYQGIFDTDFDKYTDDAVALFTKSGISTTFENLEGFPEDWKTNVPAFIQVRSRASVSEFPGIWGVSVRHGRRDQESLEAQKGLF